MARPPIPMGQPCDMMRDCPRAWVEYVATEKDTHKFIESKRSCRRHSSVAQAYMLSISDARIEVRIAR